MTDDQQFNLLPINFFQLSLDLQRVDSQSFTSLGKRLAHDKYRLPNFSHLCGESEFAEVFLGWSPEGIATHVLVHETFKRASYPDVTRGDSIELFIDTRDVKTSGFNTRFCHHFFCLPEEVDGYQVGELTHFRTEDAHEWCNKDDLQVKASLHSGSYSITLLIPSHCLVGYDPDNFKRIGFAYRINRTIGPPQHFCAVTQEFQIEQQPSLWSTMQLV